MATSGSVDFALNRNEIITEALELLGIVDPEETPEPADVESCAKSLNMMLKGWMSKPLNLPFVQKTFLVLQKDTNEYSLSSTGDHFTTSLTRTTTSAAASSGDSTITVTSATGIADTYNIGVELEDGSLQWTTVNGAPAGTTVTLTATLTDDVDSGATVYVYQSKTNRPLRIMNAVVRDSSGLDTPIWIWSRQEYVEQSNKTTDGQVVGIYYDPQRSTGKLFTWPETSTVDEYLVLWVQRPIEDMDATTDDLDLPQEWFETVAYCLASRIRPKFRVPLQSVQDVISRAEMLEQQLMTWDEGGESVYFSPSDY